MDPGTLPTAVVLLALILASALGGGCSENEDCVSCPEPAAPVAPTRVYSESGDGRVTIYWDDYPEIYGDISHYRVYSRAYDESDPERDFMPIADVPVGTNYDPDLYQYHYVDDFSDLEGEVNGLDFEYAVTAVGTDGRESYPSFELVIDTPLPMSESPIRIYDATGSTNPQLGGFDFSRAAEFNAVSQDAGIVDPADPQAAADIRVVYEEAVAYVEVVRPGSVRIQDYGTFVDRQGNLDFAGVSLAIDRGFSALGRLELIPGHIYILELADEPQSVGGGTHYAKLGVSQTDPLTGSVWVMWAYQVQPWLLELAVPTPPVTGRVEEFTPIRL